MRIVAVADTHLFHEGLKIPDGDLFIHAGDMCRLGSLREVERAAQWIAEQPHRHKVVIAGNHDWAFADDADAARRVIEDVAHYLQDQEVTIEGTRIWGSPWQPAFMDWAFNLPRGAALAQKWALIPEGIDVLVTHGPPFGIGDQTSVGPERAGCEDLRRRVLEVRPRLHLFGHIHEDGGAWTIEGVHFVNCTTWEGTRPPTVIDLERATAEVRVSAPPRQV